MAQMYEYKMRDTHGRILIGKMEAESERMVVMRLREQGGMVLSIVQEKVQQKLAWRAFLRKKVTTKDVAIMCRQFATMVNAGVPLINCLNILQEQSENQRMQEVMGQIILEVEGGSTLTAAFDKHKNIFPDLFISLVQVGETTGNLDLILDKLAVYYEKEYELKEKVKSAMTYPIFVLIMALGVTAGLIIFILPIFEQVFQDLNIELPLMTKCLLQISRFVRVYWFVAPILVMALIYQVKKYTQSVAGSRKIELLRMKMPVFGNLSLKLSFARFTMSLAIMLETGVPMMQSLEVARETLGNAILAAEVTKMQENVQAGGNMSSFLEAHKIFPVMMSKMIAVGENTGSLDTMLNKIAEFYEREARYMVERLSALLEPFLIGFLGIVIGLIVISIMMPMFSIIGGIR